MKKFLVLGALFVLPILAYLFFASGVNNFAKLPILTQNVAPVNTLKTLSGQPVTFDDKITVLGFLGFNVESKKGNAFNLNEKIYKRFNGFEDFQFVMLLPDGTQEDAKNLMTELSPLTGTNTKNWKFVFAEPETVISVYQSLKVPYTLGEQLESPYVFLIDKEMNLRGRNDKGEEVYGYDTASVAELNNKMIDDLKVLLAEYRLALKKYNQDTGKDTYLKQ